MGRVGIEGPPTDRPSKRAKGKRWRRESPNERERQRQGGTDETVCMRASETQERKKQTDRSHTLFATHMLLPFFQYSFDRPITLSRPDHDHDHHSDNSNYPLTYKKRPKTRHKRAWPPQITH